MSTLLKVRDISVAKHKVAEFAALLLYFPGKNNAEQLVYAALNCEIHLVEGLWANLLISNDILSPKRVVIDISMESALIGSCEVIISVNANYQGQFLARN